MIVVLAGKDRGKQGRVVKVLPRVQRVVVEGVNMITRHIGRRSGVRDGLRGRRGRVGDGRRRGRPHLRGVPGAAARARVAAVVVVALGVLFCNVISG